MTTNYGLDLSSYEDVDTTRTVTGLELVAQDAIWRLKTPRGMGILDADAPDYGIDLLDAIGAADSAGTAAALPDLIRGELTKDPRILTVEATVARSVAGPAATYEIRIICETADGPFELVGTAGSEALNLAVVLLPGVV